VHLSFGCPIEPAASLGEPYAGASVFRVALNHLCEGGVGLLRLAAIQREHSVGQKLV
jgi:hypothetical protein